MSASPHGQRPHAPRPTALGKNALRVARLVKAHGLKGALKLELYTDSPELRFTPGAVFHPQVPENSSWYGKTLTLTQTRTVGHVLHAFFADIDTREKAESAVRAILWIDDAEVAAGAEEDAWYDSELVGLTVIQQTTDSETVHNKLGKVRAVQHLPGQDLLTVETPEGEEVLVPLVKQIVTRVKPAEGLIYVTPPAGLFPEN